jgi:hypothetical protein
VQIPGTAGLENNSILFEFGEGDEKEISDIIDACQFASVVDFNICVLRSSPNRFGFKKSIHIWLTPGDYYNANLMILLAYIIMGHPDWKGCEVKLFGAFTEKDLNKEIGRLNRLIDQGRIPISKKNVQRIPWNRRQKSYETLVKDHSNEADLLIMGFSLDKLKKEKGDFFMRFSNVNDVLFVKAALHIGIKESAV